MSLATLDASTVSDTRSSIVDDDRIIEQAISILERRMFTDGPVLDWPDTVRKYLHLNLVQEPNEAFVAVFFTG